MEARTSSKALLWNGSLRGDPATMRPRSATGNDPADFEVAIQLRSGVSHRCHDEAAVEWLGVGPVALNRCCQIAA